MVRFAYKFDSEDVSLGELADAAIIHIGSCRTEYIVIRASFV